jgi:hypothetical protein
MTCPLPTNNRVVWRDPTIEDPQLSVKAEPEHALKGVDKGMARAGGRTDVSGLELRSALLGRYRPESDPSLSFNQSRLSAAPGHLP